MKSVEDDVSDFVQLAATWGARYLGCGGPTSRLEEKISAAGEKFGFDTQAFAVPTGVFVSASAKGSKAITTFKRLRDTSINFTELERMENLLNDLAKGSYSLESLVSENALLFNEPLAFRKTYPPWVVTLATFVVGFSSSLLYYGETLGPLLSGLLTVIVYWSTSSLGSRLRLSGIFCDFFGCLLAFLIAGAVSRFFNLAPQAIVVGSLIMIVPGLTITAAISELAEHNFVSGTVKMAKGILTLLAMGIAYLLVRDLAGLWSFINSGMRDVVGTPATQVISSWTLIGLHLAITAAFSIYFQVPKRAVPWAIMTGLMSWMVFHQFKSGQIMVIAAFCSSLSVGLASLILGRIFHLPSQIYSVPGILSLLPGMLALSSFQSFTQSGSTQDIGFRVAVVACSIVFGLFTARVPFMLSRKFKVDFQ